jgi:hypothetical protein
MEIEKYDICVFGRKGHEKKQERKTLLENLQGLELMENDIFFVV